MKKIRIGVLGVYRGTSMIRYCKTSDKAEVVAMCDKWEEGLLRQKEQNEGLDIAYYTSFDEFIKHDMDAVVLANYANEHAPFAIKALKAGKHVISEVLPCQTMKEAVELIEAIEESGLVYSYAENYCYMAAPYEMRRLYREGRIGEVEYAECEYVHNCESIWPCIAYGDPNHWRNTMQSTFYCTHSFGPIRHITGLRPTSVVGFEANINDRKNRMGAKNAAWGIEMVTLENGAMVKSMHGGLYRNNVWYAIHGSKGRMESARECADMGKYNRIYISSDDAPGAYKTEKNETYMADERLAAEATALGHGGSDFYTMDNFIARINGDTSADTIDIYEALDMWMIGNFAYRSILADGKRMDIPDLRNKEERERWRADTLCTDEKAAGEMLVPSRKGGNPNIPDEVYKEQKALWEKELASREGYSASAFKQPKAKEQK